MTGPSCGLAFARAPVSIVCIVARVHSILSPWFGVVFVASGLPAERYRGWSGWRCIVCGCCVVPGGLDAPLPSILACFFLVPSDCPALRGCVSPFGSE
jgi:hypothetical protein